MLKAHRRHGPVFHFGREQDGPLVLAGPEVNFFHLSSLAARASNLTERLGDDYVPITVYDDPIVDRRLVAWCQAVAKGEWEQFRHRLKWGGLDEATVRPVLGQVELREGVPLPAWTEVIAEVAGRAWKADTSHALFQPGHAIPFAEILAPFVLISEERLRTQAGDAYQALGPQSRLDLARALLSYLSSLAARALLLRFSLIRSRALSSLALLCSSRRKERESCTTTLSPRCKARCSWTASSCTLCLLVCSVPVFFTG
ncbi:MAG TPA: hypothetical protein VF221_12570 [Chloroflexota bacterium]